MSQRIFTYASGWETPRFSRHLSLILFGCLALAGEAQAVSSPCGKAGFDVSTESGVFLWRDCDTGLWRLRVAAGGDPAVSYVGSVTSNLPFRAVKGELLDSADSLKSESPSRVEYTLNVGGSGADGFAFSLATNATACVDAGGPAQVGPSRTLVQSPFDIGTLGACGTSPPKETPGYAYLNDAETFDSVEVDGQSGFDDRPFPRITTGPIKRVGSAEQFSKYGVIAAKASAFRWMTQVQSINPDIMGLRIHCPQEYQGFNDRDPCSSGNGMPFAGSGPSTSGCVIYPGHWLYAPGTRLRSAIGASATTVSVADASQLIAGRYVVIYEGGPGAFVNAEHARVTSINVDNGTVSLDRRGYKSAAGSHPVGSIIAEHVVGNGHIGDVAVPENWAYNLSTTSPRDSSGRQVNEVMAAWLAENYLNERNGEPTTARLAGILFDSDWHFLKDSGHNKRPDVDNDLVQDDGISRTGENLWGDGLDAFYTAVRERLPNLVLVGGVPTSRGFSSLNGTQFEGWPQANISRIEPDYREISGRLSAYSFQMHRGAQGPRYSEGFNRMSTKLYPYANVVASDNAPFRFAFGLVLLDNGYYGHQNTYTLDPWWDEYAVNVTSGSPNFGYAIASNSDDASEIREHTGWMGFPLGPRRRIYDMAAFAPERSLLDANSDSDLSVWQGVNVTVVLDTAVGNRVEGTSALRISRHLSYSPNEHGASVLGPLVDLTGGVPYTFAFAVKSSRMRTIEVGIGNDTEEVPVAETWTRKVVTFTPSATGQFRLKFGVGRESTDVFIDAIYLFAGSADLFRRDFDNAVVVVNATPVSRQVDLGGTFKRIKGTGQDRINDGSTLSTVAIPPYDSAILVRP